jgi:hypothetical protein
MDIVYTVKSGREFGDELRYSLRSLANIPHDNVWIVGDTYPWVKNVRFLNVYQGKSSWTNVHENLRRVCLQKDLSEEFIFLNDDFYIMQKIDAMPVLHGGPLSDLKDRYKKSERHYYARIVRNTFDYLGPGSMNYDLHTPMTLNKELLPIVLKNSKDRLFRSIYGNKYAIGGEYYKDTKVRSKRHPAPAATHEEVVSSPFISSSNTSFSESFVGDFIRDQFHQKCNYER